MREGVQLMGRWWKGKGREGREMRRLGKERVKKMMDIKLIGKGWKGELRDGREMRRLGRKRRKKMREVRQFMRV